MCALKGIGKQIKDTLSFLGKLRGQISNAKIVRPWCRWMMVRDLVYELSVVEL
jgi:hypothetical protein